MKQLLILYTTSRFPDTPSNRMIPRISSPLYRRRPPRALAVFLLLSFLHCIASQIIQPLSLPFSSSFNVTSGATAYFGLAPTTTRPLYITLSICAPPESLSNFLPSHLNTTLYVSNTTSIQQPGIDSVPSKVKGEGGTSKLEFGAANVTLDGAEQGLWIGVTAPDDAVLGGSGVGRWIFELDLTSDAPLVVADGGASFNFEDSDQFSALLTTSNWTSNEPQPSAYQPVYYPIVAPSTPLSYPLGRSRCFVRSQTSIPTENINTTTTSRGYGGGKRTQFTLSELREGTNYTAWLVQNLTQVSDSTNATRLWDPIFFTTKSSEFRDSRCDLRILAESNQTQLTASSCRLLYDIDFCPSVAYSVPAPASLPTSELLSHFNDSISPSLASFARSLTTFPCNDTRFGQYSVISTCQDCYEAYRDWLCAVTIPRCTDAPSNATLIVNSTLFDPESNLPTWFFPSSYSSSLLRDYPPASRTPAFAPQNLSTTFPSLFNESYDSNRENTMNESPFPYSEVPPCMDVCHVVDARCPNFLGFGCPTSGGTGKATYGMTEEIGGGERVAGDVRHTSRNERSQDRWGNV